MAIWFAAPRYIQRSKGHNAVEVAAYNQRARIYDQRLGRWTEDFSNREGRNLYHETRLPLRADDGFHSESLLWSTSEFSGKRIDSQTALEIVVPLPNNKGITLADHIEMAQGYADRYFVSKGRGVQIDIHEPHGESDNPHAHILATVWYIEGNKFSPLKVKEADVRTVNGQRYVAAATKWGDAWGEFQNEWFERRGLPYVVDPPAIVPSVHIGPKRGRHPDDPRIQENIERARLNAEASKNPTALAEHLSRQRRATPADLARYVAKHIADPEVRERVRVDTATILHNLQRKALRAAAEATKVPSGWRKSAYEDIAWELSQAAAHLSKTYAESRQKENELREAIRRYERLIERRPGEIERAKFMQARRWEEMGVVRRVANVIPRLADLRLETLVKEEASLTRSLEQARKNKHTDEAKLKMAARVTAKAFDEIRPEAEKWLQRRQRIERNARDTLDTLEDSATLKRTNRRTRTFTMRP